MRPAEDVRAAEAEQDQQPGDREEQPGGEEDAGEDKDVRCIRHRFARGAEGAHVQEGDVHHRHQQAQRGQRGEIPEGHRRAGEEEDQTHQEDQEVCQCHQLLHMEPFPGEVLLHRGTHRNYMVRQGRFQASHEIPYSIPHGTPNQRILQKEESLKYL